MMTQKNYIHHTQAHTDPIRHFIDELSPNINITQLFEHIIDRTKHRTELFWAYGIRDTDKKPMLVLVDKSGTVSFIFEDAGTITTTELHQRRINQFFSQYSFSDLYIFTNKKDSQVHTLGEHWNILGNGQIEAQFIPEHGYCRFSYMTPSSQ